MEIICFFPGCLKLSYCKDLCRGHYEQSYRGIPLKPLRFRRKINTPPIIEYEENPCLNPKLEGECHVFKGHKDKKGYGHVLLNGNSYGVHRYVWEQQIGPIPEGMVIDHQCRNSSCCNVKHLRVVTHQINSTENVVGIAWQLEAAKTHCKWGHPFNEENTHITKQGKRHCRVCDRERKATKL